MRRRKAGGRAAPGRKRAGAARGAVEAKAPSPIPAVEVARLVGDEAGALQLRLVAGRRGLGHLILQTRVQRPGLALNGYTDYIRYGRVQIVGKSEIGYLEGLPVRRRQACLRQLTDCRMSCFVVTRGLVPPPELLRAANTRSIPLMITPLDSTAFIKLLTPFLDERLAPQTELHAVLMDVFGLGVLIRGESGIGKSECALDLIDRGHRLVADDVAVVKRMAEALVGSSPTLTRHHMELRGLGLINIKDLYGVSSIRTSKRVELVVSLERWDAEKDYDRLGLTAERFEILDISVPLVRMPVGPGRNIALLIEVAARNQLLRERGFDAARILAERVDALAAPARGHGRRRRGGT